MKTEVAIAGSGHIGTDRTMKVLRPSDVLEGAQAARRGCADAWQAAGRAGAGAALAILERKEAVHG